MPAVNGHLHFVTVAFLSLALAACTQVGNKVNALSSGSGDGTTGSGSSGSVTAFSVGGDVTGLVSGASVALEDNGAASTTVSSNTTFTFATAVNGGSAYVVTVQTQPTDETCAITNGSGTVAAANISNITVACAPLDSWTWESGSDTGGASGVYGTRGAAASTNAPGARHGANSWIDASGNLWMFGGEGFDSAGNYGYQNDLWEYSAGQWKWVSGSNTANVSGSYGTQGAAASTNAPGSRHGANSWADASGNLWMFGGEGFDSAGDYGYLNDLWEYSAGQWQWVGGSNTVNAGGSYGTQGSAAAANVPGARQGAASWTDSSGNLWLFGGQGYSTAGAFGELNDLWEYSAGQWKWVSGSNTSSYVGTYGTQGSAAAANVPGGREGANLSIDSSGNLWLFGGEGFDSVSAYGELNDLWEYNAGQWKWVSGSNTVNAKGAYGTLGSAAAGNVPGARYGAVSWMDSSANLWLFGGYGDDSTGATHFLNDLWEYSAGQWQWVGGSNTFNATGVYGTQGNATGGSIPGGRWEASASVDLYGNLWLFGGNGIDSTGAANDLNDLWKYATP
jgi:N-acetylneuraminic acid mutarotase